MFGRKQAPEPPGDRLIMRIEPVDLPHLLAITKLVQNSTRHAGILGTPYLDWVEYTELPGPVELHWLNCRPADNREAYLTELLSRKLARRKVSFYRT